MFEITKEETSPLIIDERFLQGIKSITDATQNIIKNYCADEIGISVDELEKLFSQFPNIENDEFELKSYKIKNALDQCRPKYQVEFEGGICVTTDNYSEFISRIDEEPDKILSISAEIRSYQFMSQSISVENRYLSSAKFSVQGSEQDANVAFAKMKKLIKSAHPSIPFLHKSLFRVIISVSVWALCQLLVLIALVKYYPGLQAVTGVTGIVASAGVGALLFALSTFVSSRLKKAYPKVDFAIGHAGRKNNGLRSFWSWLFATVFIPILFLILGAIMS